MAAGFQRYVCGCTTGLPAGRVDSVTLYGGARSERSDATRALEGLVEEVRSSPRDFIGRAPTKELEVQP